jgi:hypothetical protein
MAMREHLEAIKELFTMEKVKLDVAYSDLSARDIPLYIWAQSVYLHHEIQA